MLQYWLNLGGEIMQAIIEQAQNILRQHQLRWTKQRKMMVESVARQPDRYFNIIEIDQYLREKYPGLSHDTIYRNFKEFEKLGIVELRQYQDQMQVKCACDNVHHHHFICERCGRVQEIKMPPIDYDFFARQLPGVQITGHSFELHGICAECRQKSLK